MVDMAKLSGRVFNGGHHDQGSAYGTISDGAMNIQNEIKLLTREELFVTLITEDANRLFAAQTLYDYYARFNEGIIQPQIAAFKEQADNLTALGTEDAPIIQREFIEALERFNKEFIVVRTA